jgi:hypothetical protein
MHEDVTTVNGQGLHTCVNEEDIFAKKELLANDTHLYDGKHVTIQVARPDAYETASKTDVTTKTKPEEAMDETYQEEAVNKTQLEIDIENYSFMKAGTNKPTRTATLDMEGHHTREEEDHFVKEEPPADNKMVDKYEYSDSRIVITSLTETLDVPKMLAYIDENYKITSQMGDENEPTADLEREKPNVRENPYSIDGTYQEEDVANNEETNGVANKKE